MHEDLPLVVRQCCILQPWVRIYTGARSFVTQVRGYIQTKYFYESDFCPVKLVEGTETEEKSTSREAPEVYHNSNIYIFE